MQLSDIQQMYEQFNALNASTKFVIAGIATFFVFMYKTFATLYAENDKNEQAIAVKKNEALYKLQAALSIYDKGSKSTEEQNELIYRFAECIIYFDYRLRSKIELFYSNRAETTLNVIRIAIKHEINKMPIAIQAVSTVEQFMLFSVKIVRPVFSVMVVLMYFVLSIFIYINVSQTIGWEAKINMICFFGVIIISFFLLTILIDSLFSNINSIRFSVVQWLYLLIIIFMVLPLRIDWISPIFLIILQFVLFIVFIKSKK
ncbi:hypothetical protein [Paenibacillus kyungheensis]